MSIGFQVSFDANDPVALGAFWSLAERSRAGTGVLLVAAFTVVALEVRLDAIWNGAGV